MTTDQLEPAYLLWCDLTHAVRDFVHAVEWIQMGEFEEAAWALWRAGMAPGKIAPGCVKPSATPRDWWDL